jgi:hypothetical protein
MGQAALPAVDDEAAEAFEDLADPPDPLEDAALVVSSAAGFPSESDFEAPFAFAAAATRLSVR